MESRNRQRSNFKGTSQSFVSRGWAEQIPDTHGLSYHAPSVAIRIYGPAGHRAVSVVKSSATGAVSFAKSTEADCPGRRSNRSDSVARRSSGSLDGARAHCGAANRRRAIAGCITTRRRDRSALAVEADLGRRANRATARSVGAVGSVRGTRSAPAASQIRSHDARTTTVAGGRWRSQYCVGCSLRRDFALSP